MDAMPETVPATSAPEKKRKPYHPPQCLSLGDMKIVTLKTGTRPDNQAHPGRR